MTISRRPEVLLVTGNGEFPDAGLLKVLSVRADVIIACDGSARRLLSKRIRPDFVVGDLDSLSPKDLASFPEKSVIRFPEQDTTDLEKAFRLIRKKKLKPSVVFLAGFTGRRTDFTLYNCHLLKRPAPWKTVLADRRFFILPVRRPVVMTGLKKNRLVSFLPLEPSRISSGKGWKYPLDGLRMAPGGRESISNRTAGKVLSLKLASGSGLLFLSRSAMAGGLPWVK